MWGMQRNRVRKLKSSVMKHTAPQKRIKSKTIITKSRKNDQIIVDLMKRNDEGMNVFFWATFVTKKKLLTFFEQLFQKLRETFQEISSNLWKALVSGGLFGWVISHLLKKIIIIIMFVSYIAQSSMIMIIIIIIIIIIYNFLKTIKVKYELIKELIKS